MNGWLSKIHSPCHKAILSLVPNCILWELWLHKNKSRFEPHISSANHVISNIDFAIRAILNAHQIIKKISLMDSRWLINFQIKHEQCIINKLIITKWFKPSMGRVKLNSDGSSKGNPNRSGGGSLLKSDSGMLIWAQAEFYGHTSNMVAETKILLQGVRRCVLQGYKYVDIEVDSIVLVGIV